MEVWGRPVKTYCKTSLRENPYYATYYVFWSKVILMELIPYLVITSLNSCIIYKIFKSYQFRRQFLQPPQTGTTALLSIHRSTRREGWYRKFKYFLHLDYVGVKYKLLKFKQKL